MTATARRIIDSTGRAAWAAGWVAVAVLLLAVGARLLAWDSRSSLVGLNAVTPLLYLPAWPVVLAAVVGHRRRLAVLAGTVVIAHVVLVLPELSAATAVPTAVRSAPSFRLFDGNVFAGNTDVTGYAEEIGRAAPDLVVLEEATPDFVAALDATGVLRDLTHRLLISRSDPFGFLVASRWPLADDDVLTVDGRPIAQRATVEIAGHELRLYAVHVVSPVGGNRAAWAREIEAVRAAVAVEHRSALVAGDFNATWGNRPFRRLLDIGLTDAAAARGSPLGMTWPRSLPLLPPVTRIDHVLTTGGLTVTRIRTGAGPGSDHRPLVADVARA